jgi:hypothetical protein
MPAAGRQQRPLTLFVKLSHDARTHILAPVVELLLELVFEELSLFLDHQDLFETLGETTHAVRFERPDHADLVQANADLRRQFIIDPEFAERLADIKIGLAGGDDSQTGRRGGSVLSITTRLSWLARQ